jgi:hypothetical protein
MLQSLAPELWTIAVPLSLLGLQLGGRMVIARVEGDVLVHSPVKPTPELLAEVRALGRVRWILAPNDFHHLYASAWQREFPDAEVWASPGVGRKQPGLTISGVVADGAAPDCGPDLKLLPVAGMPSSNEILLLHAPSKTLITTDFLFYMPGRTGLTGGFAWMYGIDKGPTQTLLFRSLIRDRQAFLRSLEPLRGWDFDRVTMTHNDVAEHGGRAAIGAVLGWKE